MADRDAFQDLFVEERLYDNMQLLLDNITLHPWDFKKMTMKDVEKVKATQQRLQVFLNALHRAHTVYQESYSGDVLSKYWLDHYSDKETGKCILCDNEGILYVLQEVGIEMEANKTYCICPSGRTMREQENKGNGHQATETTVE
jgi:hypothetical protein